MLQEQYVFVHDAVAAMFSRQLDLMQEHSDYYNFPPKPPATNTSATEHADYYNFPGKPPAVRLFVCFLGFCLFLCFLCCLYFCVAW